MIQANVAWDFGHRLSLGKDTRQGLPRKLSRHPGVDPDSPAFPRIVGGCARVPMEVRPR
jgi:hypothetical protein